MKLVTCKCCHQFEAIEGGLIACPVCRRGLNVSKGLDLEEWPEVDEIDPISRQAVASLVLGVLSLVASVFAGIPAMLLGMVALGEVARSKGRLRGRKIAIAGVVLGAIGSALIPVTVIGAIAYVRISEARQKAALAAKQENDLVVCRQNLRAIGAAIDSYVKKHGVFPLDSFGAPRTGEGLSWRVAILPELGSAEAALFARFRLNEPWDSPRNLPLLNEMLKVFKCPATPELGNTWSCYGSAFGVGSVFPSPYVPTGKTGVRPTDVADGPETTLLILESRGAIKWTSPDDYMIRMNAGSRHAGGQYHALFVDGSIHVFTKVIPNKLLDALITYAGGETFSPEDLGEVVPPK